MGSGLAARNTTEVYAAYSVTSSYVNPSLEAWWDVERVRGAFLCAAFDLPVLGWPFPPYAFAFVQGDLGLNVGQGPNAARPGELANFADRGITHVGLGMGAEMRARPLSGIGLATLAIGVRSQLNLDDATRFNGTGRNRDFTIWLWTGITGRCKPHTKPSLASPSFSGLLPGDARKHLHIRGR